MIIFAQIRRGDHWSSACKKSDFHKRAIHESPLRSRGTEIVDYTATLFRPISLKPCRDRRPRRSEKKKRLLCVWLHANSRIKSKICCFPDRRGRRSLQAKIQTASTRRYGAKTLSFSGRRVLVATRSRSRSDTTPWCHSLRLRRFATSTSTGKKIKLHRYAERAIFLRSG